jgi:hypothetical protein
MTRAPAGLLALLQDVRARVLRALEAVVDGEVELAEHVLDDLLADLGRALGRHVR